MRETLVLVACSLLAFGLCLTGSFHFDDYSLFSDPVVTSIEGWWEVFGFDRTRPLTYLTFWLNFVLGEQNPVGYHLVNLLLHLGCVALAWDTLRRLIPSQAALVAAGLFALHPIQAEPVNYVFARATVLMSLFCLLAFRSWVLGRHWISVGWFAAALLAKEECVSFPFVLLLFGLSVARRSRQLLAIAAMLVLALTAGLHVLFATRHVVGAGFGTSVSPWEYFVTQGAVILRYARLVLIPWGFTIDPDIRLAAWQGWVGWFLILLIVAVSIRRFRSVGVWIVAGLILLLPSSSFFPAADLAADRRMYLPLLAFGAALGLLAQKWRKEWLVGAAAVLIVLSVLRTEVWRTERALWAEAVERSPGKVRPKLQLARFSSPEESVSLLEDAKRMAPNDAAVASQMGSTWLAMGKPERALSEFGRALALAPQDPAALNNRGVALGLLGQSDAARQDFVRALKIDPCLFDARLNLSKLGVREPLPSTCRYTEAQLRQLRSQ